jgi:4,5-dihydroxyphthalate decarboxylase
LLGQDHWSYGLAPNLAPLQAFLRHHHAQGLSARLVDPRELFHASTHETVKV